MNYDTETIDRLFLELSQFTKATTSKELELQRELAKLLEEKREPVMRKELRAYIEAIPITSDNIGDVRRSLFMPFDCEWNGWVRDLTAAKENQP